MATFFVGPSKPLNADELKMRPFVQASVALFHEPFWTQATKQLLQDITKATVHDWVLIFIKSPHQPTGITQNKSATIIPGSKPDEAWRPNMIVFPHDNVIYVALLEQRSKVRVVFEKRLIRPSTLLMLFDAGDGTTQTANMSLTLP